MSVIQHNQVRCGEPSAFLRACWSARGRRGALEEETRRVPTGAGELAGPSGDVEACRKEESAGWWVDGKGRKLVTYTYNSVRP